MRKFSALLNKTKWVLNKGRFVQENFSFFFFKCTSLFQFDSSPHSLFFCFRAGHSHASLSLLSGWVDVVTGLERQGYTVSLFCHLPPLALTGPNTCIQAPTAQPINHCLLIQYKRKFAQGAQLRHYLCFVPIYFGPLLFSQRLSDMKG